jgi:GMP reductase
MATSLSNLKIFTAVHKHYTIDQWSAFLSKAPAGIENYIAVSTGTSQSDYDKTVQIFKLLPQLNFICIDVANGYSEHFVAFVKKMRKHFTDKVIMAGNVVTGEMVEELLLAGADIIKVGIGPGSVCTTRVKTGVGYPQVSAIIECADAAHGIGGQIISDGGCTTPGDVSKAFGAGADFVMLGGMLAGHDESGGEIIERDGNKYRQFYGMSSETAMKKHVGGVADYRASEGKTVEVPYRGSVENTVQDILGGIRSTCTYVGAAQLKELTKRTTFIRVAEQENRVYTI